jgi:hypothetical protein
MLNKNEVLRYLGWRGQELSPELEAMVAETMAECEALARPKWTHRRYPLERTATGLALPGAALTLIGEAIAKHLEGAEEAILFAATLGQEVDAAIRKLSYTDMTRSVILDASSSALIEDICDAACEDISRAVEAEGLSLGPRFSPGYGDLPLSIQRDFLAAINASRAIGLGCTESSMLLPSKSVTAVMGLFRSPVASSVDKCAACPARENCQYRRDGSTCQS